MRVWIRPWTVDGAAHIGRRHVYIKSNRTKIKRVCRSFVSTRLMPAPTFVKLSQLPYSYIHNNNYNNNYNRLLIVTNAPEKSSLHVVLRSLLLTSLASLAVLLTGSARLQAQESDHQYTSEAIEAGSRVYTQQCALCHGPQGELIDGINLRVGQFRTVQSDDDLVRVISQGAAEGRMPAFSMRPEELNGIIAYIRAGFDPEGVAVHIGYPERGRVLFEGKGECSSCHRVNGKGPRTAPDLSDIGALRTPAILQTNLLDPLATLAPINRQVHIVTLSEETVIGRRLNEDTYTVQLIDSNEQLRSFIKADLVRYDISDTPTHQPTTLSSDEVADLIGYLLTLRGLQ